MPNGAIFMQQVVTATRMGETDFSQNLRGRVWQKNVFAFPNFGSKRFYELDKSGVTWILVLALSQNKTLFFSGTYLHSQIMDATELQGP